MTFFTPKKKQLKNQFSLQIFISSHAKTYTISHNFKTRKNSIILFDIYFCKKYIYPTKIHLNEYSEGYRDIIYYVCTPIYARCRNNRNCVRSTKMCDGLKYCMNKWNTSNVDCIHLKRKLHSLNNLNDDGAARTHFIGLFFTAFNFSQIIS